jgi:hypothetical protein
MMLGAATLLALQMLTGGCATRPPLPDIKLAPWPTLAAFTLREIQTIPLSAHEKILTNQAEWQGWAKEAEAAVKAFSLGGQ